MKGVFTKSDGQLRTGLISVGLFMLLLIIPGIAMQLNQQAEQVLIKVRHQFEAKPEAVAPSSVEKTPEQGKTVPAAAAQTRPEQQTAAARSAEETSPPAENTPIAAQIQESAAEKSEAGARTEQPHQDSASGQPVIQNVTMEDDAQVVEVALPEAQSVSAPGVEKASRPAEETRLVSLQPVTAEAVQSLSVSKEEYPQLFHAWRTLGGKETATEKPALLVENLRQAFDSFNMKPVAQKDGKNFDLVDGSLLPDGLLSSYTATVFQVDSPWKDWEPMLTKLNLKKGSNLDVRYYMYDFIHNAIYRRAHQAIAWAKQQGRLDPEQSIQSLEVRGQAFAIKQQSGGRFGVFVPRQIRTATGQIVAVEPAAFAGQQDVALLQQAGML